MFRKDGQTWYYGKNPDILCHLNARYGMAWVMAIFLSIYIAFQNKKIFSKQIIKHSFIIADVTFLFYWDSI